MTYSHSRPNETRDLLARITRDQAAKQACETSLPITTEAKRNPKKKKKQTKTRRARTEGKKKREPNITEIVNSDGTISYRVQLRGRVNGKLHSLCQTFSTLTVARAWRKRTRAEIELNGFPVAEREEVAQTVSGILHARLEKDKKIERSARQYLRYLASHPMWTCKPCSGLTINDLVNFAEKMLEEGREPQTVAGYIPPMRMSSIIRWRSGVTLSSVMGTSCLMIEYPS
jgi:hypothetical protein